MKIVVAGENSLILYFSDDANKNTLSRIQQAVSVIKEQFKSVLIDLIPSYASVLVIYNPIKTNQHFMYSQLQSLFANSDLYAPSPSSQGKTVTIPVYYAMETGTDLEELAKHAHIDINDVIDIHQSTEYHVYAIGFAPGFAFLGHVDERIAYPRKATPRKKVAKGSVAIADRQTAVYPRISPGGWNIIGRSPIEMFNPANNPTMPVSIGDTVRFEAISKNKFLSLGGIL